MSEFRRRNIGYIYQDYSLFPEFTAYENVVMPILIDGKKPDENEVDDLLEELGISHCKNKFPSQMSGGEPVSYTHLDVYKRQGFEEDRIPYVFDRFETTGSAAAGHAGIGLNLSRLIIEAHHGTVDVRNNEDGKGAVIRVQIPRYVLKRKEMCIRDRQYTNKYISLCGGKNEEK